MVAAIAEEIALQRDYLQGEPLETIYFGGGTPSLLAAADLEFIFAQIGNYYSIAEGAEITLEANPDDLSLEKLQELRASPINRLSIGIQSFVPEDLAYMNRAHSADEAKYCLENALKMGFSNLTIDLIYGTPSLSDTAWATNIQTILDYQIPHISCYCLTVEPNTALDHFVKKGKAKAIDEAQAARQFEYLVATLQAAGYDHYEISNFAKPGYYAQHNGNYWQGKKYLGVGPSAHSFDQESRQWNVANNAQYLKAIQAQEVPFEREILTPAQRYNEYVMTGLRTIWGVNMEQLSPEFQTYFQQKISPFIHQGKIQKQGKIFTLTTQGKLFADNIAMELFVDENELNT